MGVAGFGVFDAIAGLAGFGVFVGFGGGGFCGGGGADTEDDLADPVPPCAYHAPPEGLPVVLAVEIGRAFGGGALDFAGFRAADVGGEEGGLDGRAELVNIPPGGGTAATIAPTVGGRPSSDGV